MSIQNIEVTSFPNDSMKAELSRQLRFARPQDIPTLRRLIDQSVRQLGQPYYNPQQIESSLEYIFGVDTQLIADDTYYVVEIEGQIVGAGGWSKRKTLYGGDQAKAKGEDNLLDPACDPAKIRAFYVQPSQARQGIGRQIMHACEMAAKAAGFKTLELMATLPGKPLYAACGFQVIEHDQIKMPDGVLLPVAKMTKTLS